jgi:hypothetical protein
VIELLLERNEMGDMEKQLQLVAPVSARMVFGEELARAVQGDVRQQEAAVKARSAAGQTNANRLKRTAHHHSNNNNLTNNFQMDSFWDATAGANSGLLSGGGNSSGGRHATTQSAGESSDVVGNLSELTALLRLLPAGRSAVKRGANDLWGRDDHVGKQTVSSARKSGDYSIVEQDDDIMFDDVMHPRAIRAIHSDGGLDRQGGDVEVDVTETFYDASAERRMHADKNDESGYYEGTESVGSVDTNMSTNANAGDYTDEGEPPELAAGAQLRSGGSLAGTTQSQSDDLD